MKSVVEEGVVWCRDGEQWRWYVVVVSCTEVCCGVVCCGSDKVEMGKRNSAGEVVVWNWVPSLETEGERQRRQSYHERCCQVLCAVESASEYRYQYPRYATVPSFTCSSFGCRVLAAPTHHCLLVVSRMYSTWRAQRP